jgi:hypothetical protein
MLAKRFNKVLIRIMKLKSWILLSLLIALVVACGGDDEEPEQPIDPNRGKSYFFLEPGKYREYNVYEIRYSGVGFSDTSEYQIRVEVGEGFTSGGETSHLVNRFRREDATERWELDSVWTARIEGNKGISVENNVPIVKMTFPLDTGNRWDSNLLNSRQPVVSRVVNFNSNFTVGLNTFLKTAEVEFSNFDDGIVDRFISKEVYRDSIGMIYKLYDSVKYCTRDCQLGSQIVQSGRYYREELIAHGFLDED